MPYQLLIFDADGTLFDYDRAESHALKSAFDQLDIPFDEATYLPLYRDVNAALWARFERGEVTPIEIRTRRFADLKQQLNLDFEVQIMCDTYLSHLAQSRFLIADADTIVRNLAADYTLVLMTNGLSDVQRSRLDGSPITPHFDGIVISEEIGVSKPDPAIFEHAFEQIGHSDKASALMIGDGLSSDIQGGVNFGIDTCWFNPQRQPSPDDPRPTYEITRLSALIDILNGKI